ncbi:MAG: insulinase family protein [Imperialibacter sp.]|uniref:M16 family metallopeptidase n=1 Tax=Imperialibacter sp. TaxID=2038411 RepID=UPI0032ECC23C
MKTSLKKRAIKAIFFLLLGVLPSLLAQDPSVDLTSQIPVDKNVKIGTLKNGMKYYIRHNDRPEDRVELRLVVNAGSILEDPSQLGLAHFTEHMAFNGTKNFKKNEIVNYLQSIGVQFGADLNAYTSFDETVYILPIPTDDEKIVNQGLQILEDWAHNLTFEGEEIDKERGVVIEEWRLGQSGERRMLDKYLPVIYKDSRYAERLPIGTKENLETFPHEAIKRFYKDWYRPDLMAVVAVGDIDVAEMEAKIQKYFGRIPAAKSPKKREEFKVPDHSDTYVSVLADKEATFAQVRLYFKTDPEEETKASDYRDFLVERAFTGMLNKRLQELTREAEPPFVYASTSHGGTWARTKDAFQAFAVANEKDIKGGLQAMITELERVRRHGFTPGELKRYKLDLLKSYEVAYNERDKSESENYVDEYVNNFLEKEPIPGIEWEYNFAKEYVEGIGLDEVNALIEKWITKENRVVVITAPDKEGVVLPTEDEVKGVLNKIRILKVDAYEDEDFGESLMTTLPKPGSIVSEKKNEALGITELDLSNGVKVFLKQTDFKNDEIVMTTWSPGGHSLASDADYQSASNAASLVDQGGIADYDITTLQKVLSGKSFGVTPFIRELSEGVQGSTTPADMETFFQLTNMYFTAPRKDEKAFQSFITKNKSILSNVMANPQYYFVDQVQRTLSNNSIRGGGFPTEADLDKIDLDKAFAFYQDRFSDVSDFTFFFVGAFKVDEIKPMLEQYIASLPASGRKDEWKDVSPRPPKAPLEKIVKKGVDQKSQVIMYWDTEQEFDRKQSYYLSSFGEVMTIKLVELLREEKGGVYGVGANANAENMPYDHYTFQVSFPCGPENVEELVTATLDELKKLQKEGVSAEDLKKIKEGQRRQLEVSLKDNSFWANTLRSYYYQGWDSEGILKAKERIETLTSKDMQEAAKKYIDPEKFIKLVLMPEGE